MGEKEYQRYIRISKQVNMASNNTMKLGFSDTKGMIVYTKYSLAPKEMKIFIPYDGSMNVFDDFPFKKVMLAALIRSAKNKLKKDANVKQIISHYKSGHNRDFLNFRLIMEKKIDTKEINDQFINPRHRPKLYKELSEFNRDYVETLPAEAECIQMWSDEVLQFYKDSIFSNLSPKENPRNVVKNEFDDFIKGLKEIEITDDETESAAEINNYSKDEEQTIDETYEDLMDIKITQDQLDFLLDVFDLETYRWAHAIIKTRNYAFRYDLYQKTSVGQLKKKKIWTVGNDRLRNMLGDCKCYN